MNGWMNDTVGLFYWRSMCLFWYDFILWSQLGRDSSSMTISSPHLVLDIRISRVCRVNAGGKQDHTKEDSCPGRARPSLEVPWRNSAEDQDERSIEGRGQGARENHQHEETAGGTQIWIHATRYIPPNRDSNPIRCCQWSQGWLLSSEFRLHSFVVSFS